MRFVKTVLFIPLLLTAAFLAGEARKNKAPRRITASETMAVVRTPTSFFLDFNDAYMVYTPGSKGLQISAQGNVLSYDAPRPVALRYRMRMTSRLVGQRAQ